MPEAASDAAEAADEAASTATIATLDVLQKQTSNPSRRLRPPDLFHAAAPAEARIPLRAQPDKLSHRESHLGLRSLFARSKAGSHDARASIVDFGSWPYSFHNTRSHSALSKHAAHPEAATVSDRRLGEPLQPREQPRQQPKQQPKQQPPARPRRPISIIPNVHILATAAPPLPPLSGASVATKTKKTALPPRSRAPAPSTPRSTRGSLATWDPPPLFQAYPQAIKHAQLPACATSVEALLRLQGARDGASAGGSADLRESSQGDSTEDGSAADKPAEKPKKKHRRNASATSMKLEWVGKIYVLVTSGYLLQYTAEGSFDRLPEKILPISKDSAAFASDLIPGRHWVLRVCSAMKADGVQVNDTRSLFSRLPFRGTERRHASTFLMVFEGAEEMESWLTILRREIEHLGGKKHLSETGRPGPENDVAEPPLPANVRTLVVRDPERFSRVLSPGDLPPIPRHRDSYVNGGSSSMGDGHERDRLSDDISTTNSVYSQDGRQLENLRDSSNRFSYISSGQRTVITTDSSSPPCSPVCDSFASNAHEEPYAAQPPLLDSHGDVRPRPNAAAIMERRQSMQATAGHQRTSDAHLLPQTAPPADPLPRLPVSSFSKMSHMMKPLPPLAAPLQREPSISVRDSSADLAVSELSPASAIPNFSVPHVALKRFSTALKSPPAEPPSVFPPFETRPQQQTHLPPSSRSATRRLPPPSLAFSRPLSIVKDQPSPSTTSASLSRDVSSTSLAGNRPPSQGYGAGIPDTPALLATDTTASTGEGGLSSPVQFQATARRNPRRHSSMLALRSVEAPSERIETTTFVLPHRGAVVIPVSKYAPLSTLVQNEKQLPMLKDLPPPPPVNHAVWRPVDYKRASMSVQPTSTAAAKPRPVSLYHAPAGAAAPAVGSQPMSRARAGGSVDTGRSNTPAMPEPLGLRTATNGTHARTQSASSSKSILYRRSMPQLANGPPPAPPPTCALPPLPPVRSSEIESRRRTLLQI